MCMLLRVHLGCLLQFVLVYCSVDLIQKLLCQAVAFKNMLAALPRLGNSVSTALALSCNDNPCTVALVVTVWKITSTNWLINWLINSVFVMRYLFQRRWQQGHQGLGAAALGFWFWPVRPVLTWHHSPLLFVAFSLRWKFWLRSQCGAQNGMGIMETVMVAIAMPCDDGGDGDCNAVILWWCHADGKGDGCGEVVGWSW